MRYSGANGEFHKFGNITNIRTVFWVWKDSGSSYFMLGDDNQYHFHRGSFMFNSGYTSNNVQNGSLRLNGNKVDTAGTPFQSNMSILSLKTTGNVEASNFSSDRDIGGRFANGDLAELLIYNTALSDAQISNIEYYLNHKWGLGHTIESSPMIILGPDQVQDSFGEGNNLTFAITRKMHRAVTRGDDLIAWWPFDDDPIGPDVVVTGKSPNERTANLFNAEITRYGRFGRGVYFDKQSTNARMRINDDGVDIGGAWTLSAWVKNILPPVSSGLSTLYRGEGRQSSRDYDRYLVIRGSNGLLHSFDGADGNANNRFRSTGYFVDTVNLDNWHLLTVVGKDSRTYFYLDGVFIGDSDRKEQSDVYYVGNSSNNELFAECLDDVRIYGSALTALDVSAIYGGGFGDQFPSIILEENSTREDNPRIFNLFTGKDNLQDDLTGFDSSDWIAGNGNILDMNATGVAGEYRLSIEVNGSESFSVLAPSGSGLDSDGKPMEEFTSKLFSHELVYSEESLLSRWSFEEENQTKVMDRGIARNDGFLINGAIYHRGSSVRR